MIRLNVFLLIEEESNRRPLIEAATRLTELSLLSLIHISEPTRQYS